MARPAIVNPPKQEVGMVAKEIAAKRTRAQGQVSRHEAWCFHSIIDRAEPGWCCG
jgi:hypothetical protein